MTLKIGYQGMEGSNSEEAAKRMVATLNLNSTIEYVPLISSQNVVTSLVDGTIDYGVMATYNSVAGDVIETSEAIFGLTLKEITHTTLSIHHCLFKKHEGIDLSTIDTVVSHIQALLQTQIHLKQYFPHLQPKAIEDTAIGAMQLAKGLLPENTAVICRKNAGELFGLTLVKENIEDCTTNQTSFTMFSN